MNPGHLHFLRPLIKWKILTIENLFLEGQYPGTYKNFHKIIRTLEKKGIIQGFRGYFSRKKYVFATEIGNDLLLEGGKFTPNHHSMFHDTKMAELMYELRNHECVNSFELEHVYRDYQMNGYDGNYYPDAIAEIQRKDDEEMLLAIELELTQKSTNRIRTKFKRFIEKNQQHYVVYFFSEESIMNKYIEVFKSEFEKEFHYKFIFALNRNILQGKLKINESNCYYNRSNESVLERIFGKRLNGDSRRIE